MKRHQTTRSEAAMQRSYAVHDLNPGDVVNGGEAFELPRRDLRGGWFIADGCEVWVAGLTTLVTTEAR